MAETILEKSTGESFVNDYTRYAVYVTYKRVLADLRDGLKPVQRRVLYDMYKFSKAYGNNLVKSSAVVGDTMAKLHPHGDSSIYGTMKPLTNDFECKVPLIDHQGNFGDFSGSDAAASRYTHAGLSDFAMECVISDLVDTTEAVEWDDNYEHNLMEPEYLPVKVPLLLINGSFGIGLGIKPEIPSHNLSEVIDATLSLLDNPSNEVILVPDHCMECEIVNTDFRDISNKGYGYYIIRGKIDIEDYKGKKALVIKSIPNLIYLNTITDAIEKLISDKKLIQIENCFDESQIAKKVNGKREMDIMRYVIVLKPGSNPEYVRDIIYKNTSMEEKLRINFQAIYGLNPVRMSYKNYLLSFIQFRKHTKFKVYTNQLQSIQTKIHEREAFIKVLESGEIDYIIDRIKKQKNTDDNELIDYLISKLKITDMQAKYILGADLRKLSIGYLQKYKDEAKQLESEKSILMNKVSNDKYLEDEIRQELITIKSKYGKPRKCKIVNTSISDIPQGMMYIGLTSKGFIKKSTDISAMGTSKIDPVVQVIQIDNTQELYIFDNYGKVFKLPVYKIPFTDRASSGINPQIMIKGYTANAITIINGSLIKELNTNYVNTEDEYFLVSVSKSGLLKRVLLNDFTAVPSSGIIYSKIDDNDEIASVIIMNRNTHLIIYSDKKAVRLALEDIPLFKRNTKGTRAMNSEVGIDGICLLNPNTTFVYVVTNNGRVNKINVEALPVDKRSRNGFNIIKLGKNDYIKNILSSDTNSKYLKIISSTEVVNFNLNDIEIGSSIGSGQKLTKDILAASII